MEKEDWHNGYEIHAYSFIKIWKIVRAIKKGEKTACNYSMLSYLYDNFDILNNKAIKKNALYYALKAIRTDKNYPPAYWLAGSTYFALNKYDLSEKYLTKAVELGGKLYYLPKFNLFSLYLDNELEKAYKIGTDYLNYKVQHPYYWIQALSLVAIVYGYGIEYKITFKKCLRLCMKKHSSFDFGYLLMFFCSFFFIFQSIYLKRKISISSLLLADFVNTNDYDNQLSLLNKIIIRQKRENKKDKVYLAKLYLMKTKALVCKQNPEYDKALEALERCQEDIEQNDLDSYYFYKAICLYKIRDLDNALVCINEALNLCKDGINFELKIQICNSLKRFEDTINTVSEALECDDFNKSSIYKELIIAYKNLERDEDVIKTSLEALEYDNCDKLFIYENLSSAYHKLNRYEDLIKISLKLLISGYKRRIELYVNLAQAYFELKEYEKAIKVSLKALEYDVIDDERIKGIPTKYYNKLDKMKKLTIYTMLYISYISLRKYKEALLYLNQVLLIEQTPIIYLKKAECLEALGDIKEAQKNYAIYNELSKDET